MRERISWCWWPVLFFPAPVEARVYLSSFHSSLHPLPLPRRIPACACTTSLCASERQSAPLQRIEGQYTISDVAARRRSSSVRRIGVCTAHRTSSRKSVSDQFSRPAKTDPRISPPYSHALRLSGRACPLRTSTPACLEQLAELERGLSRSHRVKCQHKVA